MAAAAEKHPHDDLVEVTLTVTDDDGNTTRTEMEIPDGSTPVPTLKQELGVPEADSLFLLKEGKKPKPLVDHESHNVKADDRFDALGKGGAS